MVGTKAWTNGPTITLGRKATNVRRSETAAGLSPKATYEFQACGKEFSVARVTCVGADGKPDTSQQFVTIQSPGIQSPGKAGHQAAAPTGTAATPIGTKTTTSGPTISASQESSGVGGGGGTSPLVSIAIGVGTGALVLGGTWWASRRFHW